MKYYKYTLNILTFLLLFYTPNCWAAPMEVYVSIPPQKWLSDQIGGERILTHVLVAKGQDPHTYEPTPKQITNLSRSKIYFTIGMEFEEQITRKLGAAVAGLTMVDVSRSLTKIAMVEGDHNHADEPADHGHHAATDPHVWLSPVNLSKMANVMAEAMISADPDHAEIYRQNLQRTSESLAQLHQRITNELAPFKGSAFYVFHPSFGYFAREYDLQQEAVEISGKSPSPKQLLALIARAKEDNVRIIFVQPQFDIKSANTVAQAINGVVEPLDALAEDVADNLLHISTKIAAALSKNEGVTN